VCGDREWTTDAFTVGTPGARVGLTACGMKVEDAADPAYERANGYCGGC
jgi:hypothetical protein